MLRFLKIVFILFSVTVLHSCKSKKAKLAWRANFPKIGSQSSPRAVDLNSDGVLDIVMGAGENEFQKSAFGVLALDGNTGNLLWKHDCIDQVYGSPVFEDINADGTSDIFIGGRSNQLYAIDGKTGKNIWTWKPKYTEHPKLKYADRNMQNPVVIPDKNGDGIKDLLVICGGNAKAEPFKKDGRLAGVLMILNSKNGDVLAADIMPDGGEAYMPPLYVKQKDGSEQILFGTGGETLNGNLFVTDMKDLMQNDISKARIMASDTGHGFIAPACAADINDDGIFDFVAISHGSKIFAIDGKSLTTIWKQNVPNTESSNAFAVGYFTNDKTPDFFTFVSKGVWPDSKGSVQVMLDGKTGAIAYQNQLGCTGFSSPVVYDLNNDGRQDAIISINEYNCERGYVSSEKLDIQNKLLVIDFANNSTQEIDTAPRLKNIFTTPYLSDLDGDGYLDIVYGQYFSATSDLILFMGMDIKRVSTNVKIRSKIQWEGYMGNNGASVFEP